MKRVSWQENFKNLVTLDQEFSYLPYISDKLYVQLSDLNLNDELVQKEIVNTINYPFYKWLVLQKKLYDKKQLKWKYIECLQKIDFLPKTSKLDERDLAIYNHFFNNLTFELTLVKKHVDNYYYSTDQDNYDLSDYIQEVTLGVLEALKKYNQVSNFNTYLTKTIFNHLDNYLITNKSESADLAKLNITYEFDELDEIIYSNLLEMLNTLSFREKDILISRYFYSKKYAQIALENKLSAARISAIRQRALSKLRHLSRSKYILDSDYLDKLSK